MTEKPRFKRAFTDEDIVDMLASVFDAEAHEIRRCYELLAEAERMAENIEHYPHCDSLFWDPRTRKPCMDEDVCVCHRRQAREFLERLSK